MATLKAKKGSAMEDEVSSGSSEETDGISYGDGRRMRRDLRKGYLRKLRSSEGFDIILDQEVGTEIYGPILPDQDHESDPVYTQLSRLTLDKFNADNDTNYKFVKILTVNIAILIERSNYLTFEATDDTSDSNATKVFQAKVWLLFHGGNPNVVLCRLKELKQSGDEGDSNVDVNTAE